MLGFGSSGVILSIWKNFFRRYSQDILPWLMLFSGFLMVVSPYVINLHPFRFDTFLLFSSFSHVIKLASTCLILFLPFLFGATAIGLVLMIRSSDIPAIYAWNLSGSALGGIVLIILSFELFPMNLGSFFGIWALFAGILVSSKVLHKIIAVSLVVLGIFVLVYQPTNPITSEFKTLTKTLLLPKTRIIMQYPLPQGTVEFVSSENIRHSIGLSLEYIDTVPLVDIAFLNGQFYSVFEKGSYKNKYLRSNIFSLPYYFHTSGDRCVLLLQPNSTYFITQAIEFGSDLVEVVEPVKPVANKLKGYEWKTTLVNVENKYPREYVQSTKMEWSNIFFPIAGNSSSSGLSAMQEQYIYTAEAINEAIGKLGRNGILAFSAFMDNPPRYSLKSISLIKRCLECSGLMVDNHLIAVRSWNVLLLLVKKSPFEMNEYQLAQKFADSLGFDMVYPNGGSSYNYLIDSTFHSISSAVLEDKEPSFKEDYNFNLEVPEDDRPFLSQFLKVSEIANYFRLYGAHSVPFLELGYFIVLASLLICLTLSVLLIAFPVILTLKNRRFVFWVWLYFSLLGLAFMFYEVTLIQKSILILGDPVSASSFSITTLLFFCAIGSFFSSRIFSIRSLPIILFFISIIIVSIAFTNNTVLPEILQRSRLIRLVLLILAVSPLAFFMGMAFPLGMKILSKNYPDLIPVAWGVNGFFSVIAAPLATIIAVEGGYNNLLLFTAALYFLASITMLYTKR